MHLKQYILLLFYLLIPLIGFCQELDPPILKEVSVVLGSGNVRLEWEITDSGDVQIRRWEPNLPTAPGYIKIGEITDTSITSFTDINANAENQLRLYTVRTVIIDQTNPDFESYPTNLLTWEYDSCKSELYLSWTNTASFPIFPDKPIVSFVNYEIFSIENGVTHHKIGETVNKHYTITDIEEAKSYTFYITAIPEHAPGSKSTSNTIDFYSEMSQTPTFINAQKASVSSGIVNLVFEVDPNSELTLYKLVRSNNLTGPYDTIQHIDKPEKTISLYDTKANTSSHVYYYKLIAFNNCNKPIIESDIINTIFISAKNNDKINTLTWNAFKEDSSPFCNYRIFRTLGNDAPTQVGPTLFEIYSYEDDISDLIGSNSGSEICYYVYGWESLGSIDYNNSNIACIYIEPKVYIPDAFMPNVFNPEGRDKFYIKFSFLPSDFMIKIYNRWSNIVYESTNPNEYWDGRTLNGNLVPAGAYIYYLKIETESGKTIEKRGNITVIYP